jgi:hypothetical protein
MRNLLLPVILENLNFAGLQIRDALPIFVYHHGINLHQVRRDANHVFLVGALGRKLLALRRNGAKHY